MGRRVLRWPTHGGGTYLLPSRGSGQHGSQRRSLVALLRPPPAVSEPLPASMLPIRDALPLPSAPLLLPLAGAAPLAVLWLFTAACMPAAVAAVLAVRHMPQPGWEQLHRASSSLADALWLPPLEAGWPLTLGSQRESSWVASRRFMGLGCREAGAGR